MTDRIYNFGVGILAFVLCLLIFGFGVKCGAVYCYPYAFLYFSKIPLPAELSASSPLSSEDFEGRSYDVLRSSDGTVHSIIENKEVSE